MDHLTISLSGTSSPFPSAGRALLPGIPLEHQCRTMLATLCLGHQYYGDHIYVQGSIVLSQPSPDLIEQRFDLVTRYRSIATTGIDQRSEQPQRPVQLRHPLGMKLRPNPPASGSRFFKGLDHSVRRRGCNLQAWCQLFHRLVMHGQHRIEKRPIECTSPTHRHRQPAVWSRKLDGVANPVRGGNPASRAMAQQWRPLLRPLRSQVLVERSSQRHVHELHPPADAQRRDAEQPGQQRDIALPHVAPGIGRLSLGMRLLAVQAGRQITATGQDQSIQLAHHRPDHPKE